MRWIRERVEKVEIESGNERIVNRGLVSRERDRERFVTLSTEKVIRSLSCT